MSTAFENLNSPEFLQELRADSQPAVKQLVDTLAAPLVGFLRFAMDVPEADAEEIASDVLFTVTRKIHTFKCGGRAKLTTWIYEIARNRAIDFHRKTRVEEVEFDDTIRGSQNGESFACRNQNMLSWLAGELRHFSDADRQLLLWRAREIEYATIAQLLEITEGAARTRHARALAKLLEASRVGVRKVGR